MRIANNAVVAIEYELTNGAGQLLDSTTSAAPLEYLHGAAGILPTLERQLAGKAAGDSFDVTITPDKGFGERQPDLIQMVPRDRIPNSEKLFVGAIVEGIDEAGGKRSFQVRALDDETVTLDGNHPLAGETLRFKGTVLGVREATAEELATSIQ